MGKSPAKKTRYDASIDLHGMTRTEAVEAVCANTLAKPVSHGVIPAPHPAIVEMVEFSAERLKRQGRVRKEEEDQSYLQQV